MTEVRLLDTHCHVSAYADPVAVLKDAEAASVAVVAVTENPDEFRRLRTRLGARPHVEVAIGLHPLRAATFGPNDLARFFRLLPQARWIGEVGLDYSRVGIATAKAQRRVFDVVLTEAQPGRHPLTVHSRGAEQDVVRRLADAKLPSVLHWYSGPLKLVDEALQAGSYFSINVAMTRSRRSSQLAQAIPRDRVLLETDGPYAKDRGTPAQPRDLHDVVATFSRLWDVDDAEATRILVANQARLLSGTS